MCGFESAACKLSSRLATVHALLLANGTARCSTTRAPYLQRLQWPSLRSASLQHQRGPFLPRRAKRSIHPVSCFVDEMCRFEILSLNVGTSNDLNPAKSKGKVLAQRWQNNPETFSAAFGSTFLLSSFAALRTSPTEAASRRPRSCTWPISFLFVPYFDPMDLLRNQEEKHGIMTRPCMPFVAC